MNIHTIALIGNPNSGKTSLFNALTGARQRTGNWPGVTVERKEGEYRFGQALYRVIDLPGTYTLDAAETSPDEGIARDFILSHQAEVVVNIADASHLERALYLTLQLAETGIPQVLALNMMDLARERGIEVDCQALETLLNLPVVPLIAKRGEGIDALKKTIARQLARPKVSATILPYPPELERAVTELLTEIGPASSRLGPAGSPCT